MEEWNDYNLPPGYRWGYPSGRVPGVEEGIPMVLVGNGERQPPLPEGWERVGLRGGSTWVWVEDCVGGKWWYGRDGVFYRRYQEAGSNFQTTLLDPSTVFRWVPELHIPPTHRPRRTGRRKLKLT